MSRRQRILQESRRQRILQESGEMLGQLVDAHMAASLLPAVKVDPGKAVRAIAFNADLLDAAERRDEDREFKAAHPPDPEREKKFREYMAENEARTRAVLEEVFGIKPEGT